MQRLALVVQCGHDALVSFDLHGLFRSVDQERAIRGLTWTELGREVGVSTTTIRRLERATDAEADGVLSLIRWLGVAPEEFVPGSAVVGEPLPPADGGWIRVDMTLVTASGRAGGRTSMQRLVSAAQAAGRSVASLTRRSED